MLSLPDEPVQAFADKEGPCPEQLIAQQLPCFAQPYLAAKVWHAVHCLFDVGGIPEVHLLRVLLIVLQDLQYQGLRLMESIQHCSIDHYSASSWHVLP